MSKNRHINIYSTIALLWLCMLISSSCIRKDMVECPVPSHTHSIVIKVVDSFTGEDITTGSEIENTRIFLFDQQTGFIKSIEVTADQIKNRENIEVNIEHTNPLWISVWGNLTGKQEINIPPINGKPEQGTITVVTNENDFSIPLDNLFFGENNFIESDENENIVAISFKNARLNLTARNLQKETDDKYYFVISSKNHGYNLRGTPIPTSINFKESGIFLPNNDFNSSSVLNVVHTKKEEGDHITISVYKKNDDPNKSDVLLGSAFSDNNDKLIAPQAGETTNILLDFQQELKVYIEITSWNEIYHWIKW